MGVTALQARGEGLAAAVVGEYRGARSAARFADPQAELEALRNGCGVYDLGFRAKISITGGDRVRWLNGMVTNNVRDLASGHGVYAFLLNPQGHILGDLYAYNRGDSGITVDTDCSQVEQILATFDHYIIMDDVEVKNLSASITSLGIAGPKAREVMDKAGIRSPEITPLQLAGLNWNGLDCSVVRADRDGYEIWIASDSVRELWNALLSAGGTPVGFEALETERILAGVPRYGVDIRERDLPQETEQARALNFNKGCYIGQEIVERIRSRGAVHRKFTSFVAETPAAVAAKITVGGKEVGEITSAASAKIGNEVKHIALGYIRREFSAPGREVMAGSVKAQVAAAIFSDFPSEVRQPA